MTVMDIDDKIYKEWVNFYSKHSRLEYPTLKNFTARKLEEMIISEAASSGNTTPNGRCAASEKKEVK